MSWQYRAPWQQLPVSARLQAQGMFPRSRRPVGPGDGWLDRYSIQEPPAGYSGPLPFCQLFGRQRG